jgi:Ca2+-binding RTX toxin-like protein
MGTTRRARILALTSTGLLCAALTGFTALPPAAAAAAEICNGQEATLVGEPGETLVGTDGDDVIVTRGAALVEALAGADTICVTGSNAGDVRAGSGDDLVDTTALASFEFSEVDLGAGSDTYVGGAANDFVDSGDASDKRAEAPIGVDVIDTGPGADSVHSGVQDSANDDRIDLGADTDSARIRGAIPAELDGSGGRDTIELVNRSKGEWRIDGAAGTFALDGSAMGAITSFARFDLTGIRWSSLVFRGGDGRQEVVADKGVRTVNDGPFSARMGGGNDTIYARTGHTGPFRGGPGRDVIEIANGSFKDLGGRFTADLQQGSYRLEGSDAVRLTGVEAMVAGPFSSAVVFGDDQPNRLNIFGCDLSLSGRGGNDLLSVSLSKPCEFEEAGTFAAYGGAGNDVLDGSNVSDVLIGGPGFDVARGRAGRDRCVAERETDCER